MNNVTLGAEYLLGSWTVHSVGGTGPGIDDGAKFFIVGGGGGQYQLQKKDPMSKIEWNGNSPKIPLSEINESENGVTYLLQATVSFGGSSNKLRLGTNDDGEDNLEISVGPPPGSGGGGNGTAGRP
jgi:hypothetical protein